MSPNNLLEAYQRFLNSRQYLLAQPHNDEAIQLLDEAAQEAYRKALLATVTPEAVAHKYQP